jgi:hypothetical protein
LTTAAALTAALGLAVLGQGPVAADTGNPPSGSADAVVQDLPWLPWLPWGHRDPVPCMALYNAEQGDGTFKATVEVMNHHEDPMYGWSVTWKPGRGTHFTRVRGGWMQYHRDGTVTVRSSWSNFYVPPHDQSVTFEVSARSELGYDWPNGYMTCTSP